MIDYGTLGLFRPTHEIHVCIALAFGSGIGRELQGHGRACNRASAGVERDASRVQRLPFAKKLLSF